MNCPACGLRREEGWVECPRCGLIYAKYRERPRVPARHARGRGRAVDLLLRPGRESTAAGVFARGVLLLLLFVWSWWFILSPMQDGYALHSFMHLVILPIHEAGHVFFGPLGHFMMSLGGSLMQVIVPFACACVLLFGTRDPFGASAALWWTGESLMDMAPYIDDARRLTLPLIGGNTGMTAPYGFHDWQYVLTESGLLEHDHAIARICSAAGSVLMLLGIAWGAAVLIQSRTGGRGAVPLRSSGR